MKVHKKISTKVLLVFLAASVLVLVAGLAVLGIDYNKYRSYQNSQFFGSKDVYAQHQPLYFDNLKFTVTELEHKNYDYQTSAGCMKLAEEAGALMRANRFVKTSEWEIKSFQSEHCSEMADLYENKKMLIVHYFVENTGNTPLDISPYTIKVYGDEKAESTKSENKITTLLANQTRYDAFVIHHLGINEDGPFALIISKDGKQKQIQLNLPEIAPFCDLEVCKQQVYDRKYQ